EFEIVAEHGRDAAVTRDHQDHFGGFSPYLQAEADPAQRVKGRLTPFAGILLARQKDAASARSADDESSFQYLWAEEHPLALPKQITEGLHRGVGDEVFERKARLLHQLLGFKGLVGRRSQAPQDQAYHDDEASGHALRSDRRVSHTVQP